MGVRVYWKKQDQSYYVWVTYHKQRMARKVGPSKKFANEVANEYRKQLLLGTFDFGRNKKLSHQPPQATFGEFTKTYLTAIKPRLKINSLESYTIIVKSYLLPFWKDKLLTSIGKKEIKDLLTYYKQRGLVVNNIKITISAIMTYAVEQELIPVNPCRNLGKEFNRRISTNPTKILSKQESNYFLQVAQQRCKAQDYLFFLAAFRTGLRLGELRALRYSDIDLTSNKICISRSYSHGHWDSPKSYRIRYVDISNQLKVELEKHYKDNSDSLIFPSNDTNKGIPISDRYIRGVFYRILKDCNLPKITLHQIRHSVASQLIQEGAPILYVSTMLGHSTPTTTLNIYSHLIPSTTNQQILNRLDS